MIAPATPAPHVNGTQAKRFRKPKSPDEARATGPGSISMDEVYTVGEFSRRLSIGRWGLREMRTAGLVVRKFHNRSFVLGSDFADFLRLQAAAEANTQ